MKSLTDEQRGMIAQLAPKSDSEKSHFGQQLVAAAAAAIQQPKGDPLSTLAAAKGTTGPAFAAFGNRAVHFRYMTQDQLDRIAGRLVDVCDAEVREAAVVAAMRRFLALSQPLGGEVRLVGAPQRSSQDLNGLNAQIDGLSPPGGSPEVYNLCVQLPGQDEPQSVFRIEPKYMRPAPIVDNWPCYDPNHDKIPEDDNADGWYDEQVTKYEQLLIMMGGRCYGPSRPS